MDAKSCHVAEEIAYNLGMECNCKGILDPTRRIEDYKAVAGSRIAGRGRRMMIFVETRKFHSQSIVAASHLDCDSLTPHVSH